jgi:HTH-type transcriptional regulator / antitoxin HigA
MATPQIKNEKEYKVIMERIDALMRQGESNISKKDATELSQLAAAAEEYEDNQYRIPLPTTLAGILELEMFKRKLKQKEMAKLLSIGEAKFSQILSSKRDPDVAILKAANDKLGIDGNLLLRVVSKSTRKDVVQAGRNVVRPDRSKVAEKSQNAHRVKTDN